MNSCRICGTPDIKLVLEFAEVGVAGLFVSESQSDIVGRRPLQLYWCSVCALLQQATIQFDADEIYSHYHFASGTSDITVREIPGFAEKTIQIADLSIDDAILEIGSSDGALLSEFQRQGYKYVFGCEPASNLADISTNNGIPTFNGYFSNEGVATLGAKASHPRLIIARHVFEHIENLRHFMDSIDRLAQMDTVIAIEVPYLVDTLENKQYDNFYHQHLSYFTVTALAKLLLVRGYVIKEIAHSEIAGGAIQVYAGKSLESGPSVEIYLEREIGCKDNSLEYFERFRVEIARRQKLLIQLLNNIKAKGKTIAGCGAGVRASSLLSICGLNMSTISFIFDIDPNRCGMRMAGLDIPIIPEKRIMELQPDYVLILTPEYADKIISNNSSYLAAGGCFIKAIPEIAIVSMNY